MAGKPFLDPAERAEVIASYQQGVDMEKLMSEFDVCRNAIERILTIAGVPIRKAPGGSPRTQAETELVIVSEYRDQLLGSTTIAKKHGVCKKTVFNILQRHGVGLRPKGALRTCSKVFGKTTREGKHDAAIARLYSEGQPPKKICEAVGCSLANVYHSLRKRSLFFSEGASWTGATHAIKPSYARIGYSRRSALREDAFDDLSHEALYWAGFIMADGNIHKDITRPSYRLAIRLALHDRVALDRFKEWIGASVSIITGKAVDDRRFVDRSFCVIQITSNAICSKLIELGIVPQKSSKESGAAASDECRGSRDFWRGMIDGDGCVYASGAGTCYLSGTEHITTQFMDYCRHVHPNCGLTQRFHKSWCGKEGCWVATIDRRADASVLLKHLYAEAVWALPRKLALAKTHFQ